MELRILRKMEKEPTPDWKELKTALEDQNMKELARLIALGQTSEGTARRLRKELLTLIERKVRVAVAEQRRLDALQSRITPEQAAAWNVMFITLVCELAKSLIIPVNKELGTTFLQELHSRAQKLLPNQRE
jgi:hypothetical protein